MDIPNIRTPGSTATPGLNPATTQAGGSSPQGTAVQAAALSPQGGQGTSTGATGSSGAPAAASAAPASAAPAGQEKALQQAVAKLNKQLEQQSAGITLSAGLDTSGAHPGQVLVALSDKQTKQTFYKYYLPPQNVIQAADQAGGSSTAGVLLNTKA